MRPLVLLFTVSVLVLPSCRGARLTQEPGSPLLAAHRADARASVMPGSGQGDLTEVEAKVLDIRKEWEQKLQAPEVLGEDEFSTDELRAALDIAGQKGFPESLAQTLTLEQVLAGVYVRSPTLEAARNRLRGTIEQFAQVTYLDNVLRQYASFLRSSSTRVRPSLPMDTVAKRFPFPGTLELKAAIVSHSVQAAQAKYEATLRQVMAMGRSTYADLVYTTRAITITDETLRYLEQIEETARGKLSAGTTGKSHVIQVQVQVSQIENDLLTLTRKQDTLRARLRALLDLPSGTVLASPESPPLPAEVPGRSELLALALEARPAVAGARAKAARSAAMIELAEQGTYPELSAGLSVFEDVSLSTGGTRKDREPFTTRPKVKPDPFFGSKEAYLREAREAERAARELVRAAEAEAVADVTAAVNALDTARSLRDLYRDVQLAQARQAYEDAFSSYGVDRAEFMDVIDALRQWLRFRLDADGADRDIQKAYAQLERAVGMKLGGQE